MSLLPSKPDLSRDGDVGPRVIGVDSDDADDLMAALSSTTARELLSALHEDPTPPSELADRVDTSLQNAQYHLEKLESAGAVEVVGTAYSEKGREMDVYAPADQPLVIFAGREEETTGVQAALSRLLGGVAALAVGAVAVQEVFGRGVGRLVPGFGTAGSADGGGRPAAGATPTPTSEPGLNADGGARGATSTSTASDGGPSILEATGTPAADATGTPQATAEAAEATRTATEATRTATEVAASGGMHLPPGLFFFLGGLTVLVLGIALTYRRR